MTSPAEKPSTFTWLPVGALLFVALLIALGSLRSNHFPAEDFSLPIVTAQGAAQGDRFRLSEQRGKVVLLDFWATWCGPCRFTTPTLVRMDQRFRERGLVVVGVDADSEDPALISSFARRFGMVYTVLSDDTREASRKYHITGLPTLILIDRKGTVRYTHVGVEEEGTLVTEIEGLL